MENLGFEDLDRIEEIGKRLEELSKEAESMDIKYYEMRFDGSGNSASLIDLVFNNSSLTEDKEVSEGYYSPSGFDEVIVYITYNDGSYETALYETSNTYGTVSYYSAFAGTVRLTQSAGVPQETNNIYFGDYMLVNDGSSVVLQASDSYTYSGSLSSYYFSGIDMVTIGSDVRNDDSSALSIIRDIIELDVIDGFEVEGGSYFGASNNGSLYSSSGRTLYFVSESDARNFESFASMKNIRTIGEYAFRSVDGANSIVVPSCVSSIEDYAFAESSLTSVTLSSNVTSMGSNIFYNCYSGTVTLSDMASAPSDWPSDWNNYDSYSNKWSVESEVAQRTATVTLYRNYNNSDGTIIDTMTVSVLEYPEIPTRSGYVFAGWYSNRRASGSPYDFSQNVAGGSNITLYARWIRNYGNTSSLIPLNGSLTVSVPSPNSSPTNSHYYAFVPLTSGSVTIYSTGSFDAEGFLYRGNGSSKTQIASDTDNGDGNNFLITYSSVTAGNIYYIRPVGYSSSGTTTVHIEMTMPADGGIVY